MKFLLLKGFCEDSHAIRDVQTQPIKIWLLKVAHKNLLTS